MVAFRSVRRPGADEGRLTAYDDWAHTEAMGASGFVHYFKGPTLSDGRCMSFCLWDSRAEARAAAGRPAHTEAAALTHEAYSEYTLEFHRVTRLEGAEGFSFEPYDAVRPDAHGRAGGAAGSRPESRTVLSRPSAIALGTRSVAPGLFVAIAVAAVARLVTGFLPSIVAEVSVALLLGIVVASAAGPRLRPFEPGLRFASQRVLRLGIILLGARLSLAEIAQIGLPATGLIVVTMVISFAIVLLASRVVRVEGRLAVLIAVGSAVCGNTAIVATAPVIGARAREVAYAVATITLFGTLAVFLYPAIGHAIALPQPQFGLWAGVAVHDTSQVIATSSTYGSGALDVATVVKLIRNALMAPLLLVIAAVWAARAEDAVGAEEADGAEGAGDLARRGIRRAFPLFVLGFLALAALRTLGVIGLDLATTLDLVARTLILVALAAVGMSIHLGELSETSWRPLAIGFAVALVVGLGSLVAIVTLGLGAGIGG